MSEKLTQRRRPLQIERYKPMKILFQQQKNENNIEIIHLVLNIYL